MCFWAMVFRIQNQCAADYLIHLKFPHDLISNLNLFKNRPFRIHWHKEYLSITNHCKFARKTATQTKNKTIKPKHKIATLVLAYSQHSREGRVIPGGLSWQTLKCRRALTTCSATTTTTTTALKTKQIETSRLEIGGSSGSVGLLQRGRY